MRNAPTNPTFAARGDFRLYAVTQSNIPIRMRDSVLDYSPRHPPKDWVQGTDWWAYQGLLRPSPTPTGTGGYVGAGIFVRARSRGPDAVYAGYRYSFTTDVSLGSYPILRFCCDVVGVEGGSVIQPRIGLNNLVTKPKEWTYVEPKDFDGEWGIQIRNPSFADYLVISASYRAPRDDGSLGTNLLFRVQGVTVGVPDTLDLAEGEPAALPEELREDDGPMEIVGGSYRIVKARRKALQPA